MEWNNRLLDDNDDHDDHDDHDDNKNNNTFYSIEFMHGTNTPYLLFKSATFEYNLRDSLTW